MHVVEREQHRRTAGESLEQASDRVVQLVPLGALATARRAAILPRQRGKDRRKLLKQVLVERPEHRRRQRTDVVVERIHDQPERDVLLELGRATVEDQVLACLRAFAYLREQARLPDPRLADDLHRARVTDRELIERSFKFSKLAGTTD